MNLWVDDELKGSHFGDERLNKQLGKMLTALGEQAGRSLPTAFQDWANTKAAYRFPGQNVKIAIATKPVDFRNYAKCMIMRSHWQKGPKI